jgi:hypothetical protein
MASSVIDVESGDPHPFDITDPSPERIRAALSPLGVVADPADRSLVDSGTPPDVVVTTQPRRPVPIADANLRLRVKPLAAAGTPRHRLVAIGDSLTHGFHHFAVCDTDLSYPAMIAYELGSYDQFKRPRYANEHGGLPLNLEYLARRIDATDAADLPLADAAIIARSYQFAHEVANIWEQSARYPPQHQWIVDCLAVFGWDISDVLTRTAQGYEASIVRGPIVGSQWGPHAHATLLQHLMQAGLAILEAETAVGKIVTLFHNAQAQAALDVLNPSRNPRFQESTAVDLATALGQEGTVETPGVGDGIETLIVWLGSNNALGSVIGLNLVWTEELVDLAASPPEATVWRPDHFAQVLGTLVERVKAIKARHVIWATVPHVTIAPLTRGVGNREPGSRYYPYYVRPWNDRPRGIWPYARLTANQCRAIDSTIDQYNWLIEDAVRTARAEQRDWLLLDVAGFLDVLATRRYEGGRNESVPNWWPELQDKFQLPPSLVSQLGFAPTTEFFHYDLESSRIDRGGIFGLDGVHATTIGYGAIAQRFIDVIQQHTKVVFNSPDGTPRPRPIELDFGRLRLLDTLVSDPPHSLDSSFRLLEHLDFAGLFQLFHGI